MSVADFDEEPIFKKSFGFKNRSRLSDGFAFDEKSETDSTSWNWSVSAYSHHEQERVLVDDLLFCMQGIEGDHIRPFFGETAAANAHRMALLISPHFDKSIRELAERILPICCFYNAVVTSTECTLSDENAGGVRQAFAAGVGTILDEYQMYIVQLEECQAAGNLSLQTMWYHTQPLLHVFDILADVCDTVEQKNLVGGAILSFLHSKCSEYAGDTKAFQTLCFLLQTASKPFFFQLEQWLYEGTIIDSKNEFMVVINVEEKRRHVSGSSFDEINDWEHRYMLTESLCPNFLRTAAEKILNCGKYLNIIASCGKTIVLPSRTKLEFTMDDSVYLRVIDEACVEAGHALVSLLIDEYDFPKKLSSLKHYFLLDRGDWLQRFFESAENELSKSVPNTIPHRLENFLALAFNMSSIKEDALKEEIKIEYFPRALTKSLLKIVRIASESNPGIDIDMDNIVQAENLSQLSGFDSFSLRFDAGWPLSIVFHKSAIFKYQIIFRQLLRFKLIERQVAKIWVSHRKKLRQAILLHKLVTFVRKFLYHASVDVIEPHWHRFMQSITEHRRRAESGQKSTYTLDDLLREHNLFLDRCVEDLLLTEEPLILCVEKIVQLCREAVQSVHRSTDEIETEFMEHEYAATVEELLSHMRSLSNTRREKGWLDIAYSLGLTGY